MEIKGIEGIGHIWAGKNRDLFLSLSIPNYLMRGLLLLTILFASVELIAQNNRLATLTCNNWLSTPSTGSGVKIGDLDVSGTNITVEAVFNRNTPYSGSFLYAGDIVSKHLDPNSTNYLLRPNSAEITTSNGYFITSGPCNISLNKTYHVAMVYNGSTLKFYRNGFLMSQVNATGNLLQNNFITTIANDATGTAQLPEDLLGYINEVRVWNVARSQAEIRANMNGSLPNPTTQTGLLAYYTFDDLLNKQGNAAWNGTLVGAGAINATNPSCTYVADSCAIPVVTANFTVPDTVCVNSAVAITNISTGASNYFWNFCTADLNQPPTGTNLGNVGGTLSLPVFSDFTQYNGNYYVFVANNYPGRLTRLDFGNSLLNTPTAINLGNFGGVITNNLEGLQLVYNEGHWYAILVGGYPAGGTPSKIMKLDFGTALTNTTPTATDWGNIGNLSYPIDLHLFQENNNWYGLTTNSTNNTITRFNFGTSFNNVPTGTNLGNPGNLLQGPTGIYAINDNGFWRVFVADAQPGNKIVRLDFGTSLLNTPTAVNLGNPGNIFNGPRDIIIMNYCGQSIGFVTNGATTNNELIRLNFNGGLQNTFTTTNLGNIGNLNLPHSLSKLFRVGPDLYSFITNANSNSITRLRFAGCTSSSVPNSTLQNPPAITYNTPGVYNINLSVDEGLATQTAYCKQVVVLAKPTVNARTDTTICRGISIPLTTTATGAITYSWSPTTGLSNASIASPVASPTATTTYIVTASNGYCQSSDTVVLNVSSSCSGISNIINDYTPVTGLAPCTNGITVEDASAFKVGDTVLLMQMKGVVIDSTNTNTFGTIAAYQNAGNYEFNYVSQVSGNIISLKNLITRQYTIPDGKVQLIRVPYFFNTTVSSTLTCLPWDGRKGGVLAFNVRDTLALNADIDVTSTGFSGGRSTNKFPNALFCSNNDYVYPSTSLAAASKGESIYAIGNAILYGKGAPANGGGGGDGHNSGGGGGGNGGTGGFGGYQLETCTNSQYDNRGFGGKLLAYSSTANKTFMGGGGGSGHADNSNGLDMNGGNGGGIVMIKSGAIKANSFKIISKGANVVNCNPAINECHDASGGGGAGGTVMLQTSNYIGAAAIDVSGGKGGDLTIFSPATGRGRIGPGGGGGAGVVWYSIPTANPLITETKSGGTNGVILQDNNNPWGATAGAAGTTYYNLNFAYDLTPFQKNIDSVRIKDSAVGCSAFNFRGLEYIHYLPISSWQWAFGDGGTANTQNTGHQYQATGNYTVKLVVTDANGCKDSASIIVNVAGANSSDFSFELNACNPLSVQFISNAPLPVNNYWSFGDNGTLVNNQSPQHTFSTPGNYIVRYVNPTSNCPDTVTKMISVGLTYENILLTNDTTICLQSTKQLQTVPSYNFCWFPATYLNNPILANPVTNTLQNIKYFFTALTNSSSLLVNGSFSQGNTGFTSAYNYSANSSTASGQYNVSVNTGVWLGNGVACSTDHTTGTGNMMMVNGATTSNTKVWEQTVSITPNTNYELSGWVAGLSITNPAGIQWQIDGINLGNVVTAPSSTCTWIRFSTIWNSGSKTNIQLAIVNTTTQAQGNDFALDDLSFAPVFMRRDSVQITVDSPFVRTRNDTAICNKDTIQLQATGSATYSWSPGTSLSSSNVYNPFAYPSATTQYIVTGTSARGCTAKDTVIIQVKNLPVVSLTTVDTTVCINNPVQLSASGGTSYVWQPAATLNSATSANPIANPIGSTTYYVTVSNIDNCKAIDSVKVQVRQHAVFAVSPVNAACIGTSVQLNATGGDSYLWTPNTGLSNPAIANPIANLATSTNYIVKIKSTICQDSTLLNVPVTALPLPVVSATRSNDIDCNVGVATLTASGARTYRWSPGLTLSDSLSAAPTAIPVATTIYTVTGKDVNNCTNTDTVVVLVKYDGNGQHYMPNAFTPNGDGLNDCLSIKNWGDIRQLQFSIYNRWGQLVFYTTNPAACWDGKYKGELQQSGNFIYIIKAKTACGDVDTKGNVLLLR